MNESLRRALIHARLREADVAARLNVDPKTVRRWLDGRVPYPSNRANTVSWPFIGAAPATVTDRAP